MSDERDEMMLTEAARGYRAALPQLPASLDDRIMAAVRARPLPAAGPAAAPAVRPARPSVWRWLVEPQQVRPAWGLALAAAAVLAVVLLPRRQGPVPAPAQVAAATPHADTVYVRFELIAPAARQVALAGSFNGWGDHAIALAKSQSGVWSVTVPLPVGEHRYDFVVDGTRWVADPTAHAQVADGFGGTNSVIVVGPKGVVRS